MKGIMQISQDFANRFNLTLIAVVLTIAGLAWLVGGWVASARLNDLDMFRWGISTVLALVVLGVLVWGQRGLQVAFGIFILTFVLGYRTIHVSSALQIHPSEVLAWFLFLMIILRRAFAHEETRMDFPSLYVIWFLWGGLELMYALTQGRAFDAVLNEAKPFYLVLPVWVIVREFMTDKARWHRAMQMLVFTQFYISLLGVTEYFAPSLTNRLTPYFTPNTTAVSFEGFVRASFSFWGTGLVAGNLLAAVPFCLALASHTQSRFERYFCLATVFLSLVGVYVSGYRAMWVAAVVVLVLYLGVKPSRGNVLGLIIITASLALLFSYGSQEFTVRIERFLSLDPSLRDSSAASREELLQYALDAINASPWIGSGWRAMGWSHNDYAQMAANLGLPAAALFFGLILWPVVKLWLWSQKLSDSEWGNWQRAAMASLVGYLIIMGSGSLLFVLSMVSQFWFIVAAGPLLISMPFESSNVIENIPSPPRYAPSELLAGKVPRTG